jgi:plasmid maintenance system killer protein
MEWFYSEQNEICDPPEYVNEAADMFKEYVDYISRRLPALREAKRASDLIAREKKELERLNAKYKSE